ncbi:MAG: class I SAM-dependent methyltransferase [Chloroflexota bacterium]
MSEIYDRFAQVYARGTYSNFTRWILEKIPALLDNFALPKTGRLLDLACGEGTFLAGMAANGWQISGVDLSPAMLSIASQKFSTAALPPCLIHGDMRELHFENEFDLVTCWYDSLNYVLKLSEVNAVFAGVYRALKPGGAFVFDMNTIYGLTVQWQRDPAYIIQENSDLIEIHIPSCNYDQQMASLRILVFTRREGDDHWERFEEIHVERGYPVEVLQTSLQECGFNLLASIGNLNDLSQPTATTPRVWFIAQKAV